MLEGYPDNRFRDDDDDVDDDDDDGDDDDRGYKTELKYVTDVSAYCFFEERRFIQFCNPYFVRTCA
jgi:hypothetical protein